MRGSVGVRVPKCEKYQDTCADSTRTGKPLGISQEFLCTPHPPRHLLILLVFSVSANVMYSSPQIPNLASSLTPPFSLSSSLPPFQLQVLSAPPGAPPQPPLPLSPSPAATSGWVPIISHLDGGSSSGLPGATAALQQSIYHPVANVAL